MTAKPGSYLWEPVLDARAIADHMNAASPPSDLGGGVVLQPLHVMVMKARTTGRSLLLRTIVADRDTGLPRAVEFEVKHPNFATAVGEERRELVRDALLDFFAHEIDELLLLDGKRNDPHEPPKYEFDLTLTVDAEGFAELKKAIK